LQHSFYIPDIDYLKDLPGLMRHLADKVSVWHVCLSCGSESRQPFPSLESVRRHMLDKGHNKIRYDEEGSAELADFFDYSNLMKGSRTTVAVAIDSTEAAELDDFVTDDEYEYEGGEDDIDDNSLILAPDESELILPNGVRLGARAYRRYYRQNLMPYLDQESRPNSLRAINAPRPDGTVVRGQHYVPAPKVLTQVEKRGIKQEHYDRKNFALKMGIKGNGLQTYYREQLLQ
jgi:pre-60S factor REI1